MEAFFPKRALCVAAAVAVAFGPEMWIFPAIAGYAPYESPASFEQMERDSSAVQEVQSLHSGGGAVQNSSRRSQEDRDMELRNINNALDQYATPIFRSNRGSGERYGQLLPNSRKMGTTAISMLPDTHPLRIEARARRGRNRSAQVLLIGAVLAAVYLVPYLYMSRGGGSLRHTERFQAVYDRVSSSASGSLFWLMSWRLCLGIFLSGALNLALNLYRLEHATDMRGKKVAQSRFWNYWELLLGVPLLLLVISNMSSVDQSRRLVEPLSPSFLADAIYQAPFGLVAVGLLSLVSAAVSRFLVAAKRSSRRQSEVSSELLRDNEGPSVGGGGGGGMNSGRWEDLRDEDLPTAMGRERFVPRKKKHTRNFGTALNNPYVHSDHATQTLANVSVPDPWEDIFGEQSLLPPQEDENAERRTRRRRSYRTRERAQNAKKRTKTRTKTGKFLHRTNAGGDEGSMVSPVDDPRIPPDFEDSMLGGKLRDGREGRSTGSSSAERRPGGGGEGPGSSIQKEHRRRHTRKLTTAVLGTRRLRTRRTQGVAALLKANAAANEMTRTQFNHHLEAGPDPLANLYGTP